MERACGEGNRACGEGNETGGLSFALSKWAGFSESNETVILYPPMPTLNYLPLHLITR